MHLPTFGIMGLNGHEYDPPSSLNPGLLMFLIDKSLYSQATNLMPVLRAQITEICKRFSDADKKGLFRLVVCEFANAAQKRHHKHRRVRRYEVTFGRPIRKLDQIEIFEATDESTYKFDRYVEEFSRSDSERIFDDTTKVSRANLKDALMVACDEVDYHHNNCISQNNPPVSILMFSGNHHDLSQDYALLPGSMGTRRREDYQRHVNDFVEEMLKRENVLFGAFTIYGRQGGGQELTTATRFSEKMINDALSAEVRYQIPHDERLAAVFSDPKSELINRPFIFGQKDIKDKPKFLAALIRLGTSTILQHDPEADPPIQEDWDDIDGWGD